ncbi:MAG: hypothetical protein V4485_04240 [Pseudomonadota bacterium]
MVGKKNPTAAAKAAAVTKEAKPAQTPKSTTPKQKAVVKQQSTPPEKSRSGKKNNNPKGTKQEAHNTRPKVGSVDKMSGAEFPATLAAKVNEAAKKRAEKEAKAIKTKQEKASKRTAEHQANIAKKAEKVAAKTPEPAVVAAQKSASASASAANTTPTQSTPAVEPTTTRPRSKTVFEASEVPASQNLSTTVQQTQGVPPPKTERVAKAEESLDAKHAAFLAEGKKLHEVNQNQRSDKVNKFLNVDAEYEKMRQGPSPQPLNAERVKKAEEGLEAQYYAKPEEEPGPPRNNLPPDKDLANYVAREKEGAAVGANTTKAAKMQKASPSTMSNSTTPTTAKRRTRKKRKVVSRSSQPQTRAKASEQQGPSSPPAPCAFGKGAEAHKGVAKAETFEQAMKEYQAHGAANKDLQFQALPQDPKNPGVTLFIPPGMDPKSDAAKDPKNQIRCTMVDGQPNYVVPPGMECVLPPQDLSRTMGQGSWKMEQVTKGGRDVVAADPKTREAIKGPGGVDRVKPSVAEYMQKKWEKSGGVNSKTSTQNTARAQGHGQNKGQSTGR